MNSDELMALIIEYSVQRYLRRAVRVRIDLDDGREMTWLAPQPAGAAAPGEDPTLEAPTTEVEQAIFNKLADTCKRQTREQMSEALKDEFSESVVHKALWKLRQSGRLTNSKDGHGLGFGLPEWS